jgi:hypothetical protein
VTVAKFYVATDFARKEEARQAAGLLERAGLELNATWLTSQPVLIAEGLGGELDGEAAEAARRVADEDLLDITQSSVFVQLTSGEKARGGRHVELGFAIAMKLRDPCRAVVAVGPREHAFHYHPSVIHLPTLQDLSAWGAGYAAGARL